MMQIKVQFYVLSAIHADQLGRRIPYLETADKRVVDLLREELGAVVFNAGPSPHVLVTSVLSRVLEHSRGDSPHDHAEYEPTDSEHGVVDADLLRPLVTATAVTDKDRNADNERNTSTSKDDLLRPSVGIVGPGRQTVHRRERLGCVENGE